MREASARFAPWRVLVAGGEGFAAIDAPQLVLVLYFVRAFRAGGILVRAHLPSFPTDRIPIGPDVPPRQTRRKLGNGAPVGALSNLSRPRMNRISLTVGSTSS